MATTSYPSQLRYLDADDIDDSAIDFDGLDVRGADGHKLGDLDGFVVDSTSGRVYYAVVDSGGWFTSRRFLLPIGHARLDRENRALSVDVMKDAIRQYPEFDADRFRQFTEDEMRAFEQRMSIVCCPDDARSVDAVVQYDTLRHYSQPDWWKRDYGGRDRYRDLARVADRDIRVGRTTADTSTSRAERERARETSEREHIMAREATAEQRRAQHESRDAANVAGRAQPGDVLGIETAGERSHLGEDAEDENQRKKDAERAVERERE